ncbi:unnamed protein product [Mytilus coruscus]|uniref:Uncharacterized protein n=1 Tax=Mytilus coruscus TaxID=42192 RepID=A0A6J8BCW9_MYTCO|nr:unnamed protein product [Mytilus coruscus]
MEHDLKETVQAIKILVSQTKLFESSRNGRAILPFIGSMAKGLFGLATMSDVQLLANHINALNAKSRSITQALQQHSDHLSSFVKVIDKRTSNLMQGIKDNSLEIQTIAHSFQLAIVSSEQSMALIPITVPDCSLALFQNNVKQVSRLCNFRFLENHLSDDTIELTPTSVLVYDSEELDLICPQSQRKIPGCTFCVINIPCKCSLSTRKLYFSPRLVDCYESSSNFSILHPVNLALVQEFFDEKRYTSLLADSLFPTPVQLAIPDFSFYNQSMSKILAVDAKTHLSLKKIAVAAKKDKMIFKTLTEPLLSGDISLQSSWLDTNTIVSFCSLGIAILSLFAFVFLFCKTRKIAMTMTIMQQMSHTNSQSVPSFIYVKPTQLPQMEQDDIMNRVKSFFSSEFSWEHASVILSILVLIFLLFVICYLYKSKHNRCTSLVLEVTCGGNCVVIPILDLSLCPSYYEFSRPSVLDLTVASFPSCKMFAVWSSFEVTNKLTQKFVMIPTTLTLSFLQSYRIKKVLAQPFKAYIYVTHQGFATMLSQPANASKPKVPALAADSDSLYPSLLV